MGNELNKDRQEQTQVFDMLRLPGGNSKRKSRTSTIVLPLIVLSCVTLTIIIAMSTYHDTKGPIKKISIFRYFTNVNQNTPTQVTIVQTTAQKEDNPPVDGYVPAATAPGSDVVNAQNEEKSEIKQTIRSNDNIKNEAKKAIDSGRYNTAIILLTNYLSRYSEDAEVHYMLSVAYKNAGNDALAYEHYNKGLALDQ